MNFKFFFDIVSEIGSFFWVSLLCWIIYFFWCRFLDYPVALEREIRKGKSWPYLPIYWKGKNRWLIRAGSLSLFWVANLFGACSLYFLIYEHIVLVVLGLVISIIIGVKISRISVKDIVRSQKNIYFQIYMQIRGKGKLKGDEISDSELSSRAQWQYHNDLRQADKQGRLTQFLKGEAML